MSDITYIFLQMLILICYASWIAYRVGYSRGEQKVWAKVNVFKTWKEIK
jgi:hypothetical protein